MKQSSPASRPSNRSSIRLRLEQLEDRTLLNVQFAIDPLQNVQPISPFIYGINSQQGQAGPANLTENQLEGNRWTAYNWENNASNAGSDYYFENDDYLGGDTTLMPAFPYRPRPSPWRMQAPSRPATPPSPALPALS